MASLQSIRPLGNNMGAYFDDGSVVFAIPAQGMWIVQTTAPTPPTPPSTGQFSWPFSTSTVTSEFGPRVGPIGSFHEGIDFGRSPAVTGAPEKATMDGIVDLVNINSNYGYSVQLFHGGFGGYDIYTIYAHMVRNPEVSKGQNVVKGQLLGYLDSSGDATGPHLHWETHTCAPGTKPRHNTRNTTDSLAVRSAINPRSFMATYGDGNVL